MDTRWRTWSLSRSDGRPREGELCVVRKISRQTGAPVYSVGYLRRDPRDPTSRKRWWYRDGCAYAEDPARWGGLWHKIVWTVISPPAEGGEVDG